MQTVKLNNGIEMPVLGYGVFQVSPEECERCVLDAIGAGYRLIDTAQAYYNEEGVGNAVARCGVSRDELFLTTKVWITNAGEEKATHSIDESLRKLRTDYIDLLLIHQPFSDYPGTWRAMEKAVKAGKVRAIGEIGLDYYWEEPDKEIQKKWFVAQLDLARRLKLPVIIHSRDAAKDTLDIMKAEHGSDIGGVIHCFSYTKEMAREYLDMGFFLGIGGVLTFKNARKLVETVEYAPLDRLVLETDCPYLSPVPNRGKRNSSLNLTYVADQLAALKGGDRETVEKMTWDNARKLYRL